MSGMSGGSMLRTRRKDANVKPNRRLDRKSSRGMLYENEELRLRTININAEVERGQSDIKKLKRENEQLRREVGALRGEYDRLERLLKARHQQDNSDAEGSGSCCSDCEPECCNIQNNVNAACDVVEKRGDSDTVNGDNDDDGDGDVHDNEGSRSTETCGKLSSVPEEPVLRVPYIQTQNAPLSPCNCHQLQPCIINSENTLPNINRDYYTAVVTVPLASHLPESQNIHLSPSNVYPKAGLDILMNNNNAFEKFEGFTMAPPIGFVIPSSSNCEPCDTDSYQIVPNVDITDEDLLGMNNMNNNQSNNNINDILDKDSYFICNTKKIIQQMTTVQNTNIVNTTNLNACNCGMSNKDLLNPDVIIVSSNPEPPETQSFRTEKNIELNYDYPKPVVDDQNKENPTVKKFEEVKSQDITQTTHTTTEVNSTVMVFGRKNAAARERCKLNVFARSHSAPVEPIDSEPIYATVQKLPKNLKRLHIRKLENEIKYIPPEGVEKEDEITELPNINANTQSILKSSDQESPDGLPKHNGNLPKLKVKLDSFSESSDKNDTNPKSATVRKKKRFSIHFKRKNKKAQDLKSNATDTKSGDNKTDLNPKRDSQSDRLLEQSSSVDSQDLNKHNDSSPTFTNKKHKKPRQPSVNSVNKTVKQCPSNSENHNKVHQCEKCHVHKKPCRHACEHRKSSCSPVRNYFKNDSYQEITTSHSERERTNSLSSSGHSGFSLATNKSRKMSAGHQDENIPWCGCWGNSCL